MATPLPCMWYFTDASKTVIATVILHRYINASSFVMAHTVLLKVFAKVNKIHWIRNSTKYCITTSTFSTQNTGSVASPGFVAMRGKANLADYTSWLSDLLQSKLKMKLLEVEGHVLQCPIAGDATVQGGNSSSSGSHIYTRCITKQSQGSDALSANKMCQSCMRKRMFACRVTSPHHHCMLR